MSYPSTMTVWIPLATLLCVPPQEAISERGDAGGHLPIRETGHAFSVQVSTQQQHHEDERPFSCCQLLRSASLPSCGTGALFLDHDFVEDTRSDTPVSLFHRLRSNMTDWEAVCAEFFRHDPAALGLPGTAAPLRRELPLSAHRVANYK